MNNFIPVFATTQNVPQLKPIFNVVDYPVNPYSLWIGSILGGLFIVIIVFFIWNRYARGKGFQNIRTPEELALDALVRLKRMGLIEDNQYEVFLTKLSRIVRVYIEAQFNIHAPDMTTEEFLMYVKSDQKLSTQEKTDLKNFMDFCDQVKFAKMNPTEQDVSQMTGLAEQFIKHRNNSEQT